MRVLVTGDRDWTDRTKVYRVLAALQKRWPKAIIVEGFARGADKLAGDVACELGLAVEEHPADWNKYGRAAGPIRNQYMLDESQRRALRDGAYLRGGVAFHSDLEHSKGTKDMVRRLEKAGIPVLKIT